MKKPFRPISASLCLHSSEFVDSRQTFLPDLFQVAGCVLWLLVKPGTPEQHQSGTRNTGTLKIRNLLKTREKNTGGRRITAGIIIA